MNFSNLGEFKLAISSILRKVDESENPLEIIYSRGIDFPKYKITFEELEEDTFVDAKGQRWARIKDDTPQQISHKK